MTRSFHRPVRSYRDLIVWQKGIALAIEAYRLYVACGVGHTSDNETMVARSLSDEIARMPWSMMSNLGMKRFKA